MKRTVVREPAGAILRRESRQLKLLQLGCLVRLRAPIVDGLHNLREGYLAGHAGNGPSRRHTLVRQGALQVGSRLAIGAAKLVGVKVRLVHHKVPVRGACR